MRILAADIGGTTSRLVLATAAGEVLAQGSYASGDFDELAPVIDRFLSQNDNPVIASACLGVAGPVESDGAGQRARVTNLPWVIESSALERQLGGARVRLINDFEAVGFGIEVLQSQELVILQAGRPVPRGPRALIGAGTGLGQGMLVWARDHYEPIPTEGGHADFAASDDEQWAISRELRACHGHASWERLLSGAGLEAIFEFLARHTDSAKLHTAAQVSDAALTHADPVAVRALDLFVRLYGAQAGNLALTAGATGGVYVAGGIAPRIIAKLCDGTFMRAFLAKGRMQQLLETIPVQVVVSDDVGLRGAAAVAQRAALHADR